MLEDLGPGTNCTAVREDLFEPTINRFCKRLWQFMRDMHRAGLRYSNWRGTFDKNHLDETFLNRGGHNYQHVPDSYDEDNIPWFTMWEYVSLYFGLGLNAKKHMWILDLGGACSALSQFLVSINHVVTVIDKGHLTTENKAIRVVHADFLSGLELLLKEWEKFDLIIDCEALFINKEDYRREVLSALRHVSKPGTLFGTAFNYQNPNPNRYINNPEKQLCPTGYKRKGSPFVDRGERPLVFFPNTDLPNYCMATMFFERDG